MWKKYGKPLILGGSLILLAILYSLGTLLGSGKTEDNAPDWETGGFAQRESSEQNNVSSAAGSEPEDTFSGVSDAKIFIYLCGAVRNPAVYGMASGSRLYEAVELAGGLREDAAADAVNLAQVLEDGQRIRIPTEEEAAQGITDAVMTELAEGPAADGLVDINRASLAELMTLPGIGETRAQAVLDYRATHGPFQRIEDITNVSGIKEASYEKIKHLIKV